MIVFALLSVCMFVCSLWKIIKLEELLNFPSSTSPESCFRLENCLENARQRRKWTEYGEKFWFCSNWIFSCRRRTNKLECPKNEYRFVDVNRFFQLNIPEVIYMKKQNRIFEGYSFPLNQLTLTSPFIIFPFRNWIIHFISSLLLLWYQQSTVEIFGENSRSPSVMRNKQLNSSANYSRVENKQHEKVKVSQFRLSQTSHTRASTQSVCEFRSWAKWRTRKSNKNLQKFSTVVERFFSLFCDSICVRCFSLIFHLFGSRWDGGIFSEAFV